MVPYFLYKGLDPHKAIGTSSLMGFALALSGALGALLFARANSKAPNAPDNAKAKPINDEVPIAL